MSAESRKRRGAYYTPEDTVAALVRWAVRKSSDELLDPSCGDGRFLALHHRSTGIEQDSRSARLARERAPKASVHTGDFFTWASETRDRFDCAAGNPPFIRYQTFAGDVRTRALGYCAAQGADFTALTSSWAPFLVAAASLLKPGGRMAFVVPAEIGHAPYARPLLEYLVRSFRKTQLVAVKEKLFPDLSEDVWLLYAEGYGTSGSGFLISPFERFTYREDPPRQGTRVDLDQWRAWNGRLRPFLLPSGLLTKYEEMTRDPNTERLGDLARVGIGYVTGANEFFHLRPSTVEDRGIPSQNLHVAVRNGRVLTGTAVTKAQVRAWIEADDPVLLLKLASSVSVPGCVRKYLESEAGLRARETYKCRNRNPWYVVPDVHVPDAFLTYMSGGGPSLVANPAHCVGTNSVHTVRMKNGVALSSLMEMWNTPLREFSCEIEGHPLGGGMLKIEPREASRIVVGHPCQWMPSDDAAVREGLVTLRSWRHCDS
jgi:adenine-specific DNA methylase